MCMSYTSGDVGFCLHSCFFNLYRCTSSKFNKINLLFPITIVEENETLGLSYSSMNLLYIEFLSAHLQYQCDAFDTYTHLIK